MDAAAVKADIGQRPSSDPLPFARCYQLEALDMALKQNTIVYLETGSGKTLIATMLLRSYAHQIRKPSSYIAVFLVPKVVLVSQQAEVLKLHTDLKVGMYWGDMGVDFWDAAMWRPEIEKHEVLVMTHDILLNGLRRQFFKLEKIKVLIFDECQHASGGHAYACIMREFYHYLKKMEYEVPRILGLTASPIKTKGGQSECNYWQKLQHFETLMNSKIYTCDSESVLAKYVPIPTVKCKCYQKVEIPCGLLVHLRALLKRLKEKHEGELARYDAEKSAAHCTCKRIDQIYSTLMYCLEELGLWLTWKAADFLTHREVEDLLWGKLDISGERIVKKFCLDVFQELSTYVSSDVKRAIRNEIKHKVGTGCLASSKVVTLVNSLLEYSHIKDIRCIIFVERVITASVLHSLLNELLPEHNGWRSKSIAGNSSGLLSQSRKLQNEIVGEFRQGKVNVIVATSILEEGLDVQSCNLVIRFDPAPTISSFIQSRGRARMQNSDFLVLVDSGDASTYARLKKFLASGEIMRKESLRHASVPCEPLDDLYKEEIYRVESTGAVITLSSSVEMLYFYCSRLPSDGYFKPMPRFDIDKEMGICSLHLPKNCPLPPLPPVCGPGNVKMLRKIACFEACKQLHRYGALTDNLVPDVILEDQQTSSAEKEPCDDEHPAYFPPELVNPLSMSNTYNFYVIKLLQNFNSDIQAHGLVLAVRNELEPGISFDLRVERGTLTASFEYAGFGSLTVEQVVHCRKFQSMLLTVLVDHNVSKSVEILNSSNPGNSPVIDYLILPLNSSYQKGAVVDWEPVGSVLLPSANVLNTPSSGMGQLNRHIKACSSQGRSYLVMTKDGLVCSCLLQNSLVYTPHNGRIYCVAGFFDNLNANSVMNMRDGARKTYKEYYKERHSIKLCCKSQSLLKGRHIFQAQNYLFRGRLRKEKESTNATVELPPELCHLIIAPIAVNTVYSYSLAPSMIHRIQSLLMAANLKRMHLDHGVRDAVIPTVKVLEALTAKQCQEEFHLESLETLGDSFLKYAVSQQLFKSYENHHEGMLSIKRERIISNAALCRLACERNLPGFICHEQFDPKNWIVPGYKSPSLLSEELVSGRKVYVVGKREIKMKKVADVVEALIGAYVNTGGEPAGVMFLDWLGIKVDFRVSPYERRFHLNPEKLLNIKQVESLLQYTFKDPSLLVEALTHGSYMLPEIPQCYQRLEYLGDSVLDYLITVHLYNTHPNLSPGVITDMRSASVNNDCYALAALKVGLHKHLLHASHALHRDINTLMNSQKFSSTFMYGWESEASFPKVLGDIIESLAGAILVDSGYDKQRVFDSMRPLLEPLITPETLKLHPVRELSETCQKQSYTLKKPIVSRESSGISVTVEVEASGTTYKHTSCADNKKTAQRVASKEVLNSLKQASAKRLRVLKSL